MIQRLVSVLAAGFLLSCAPPRAPSTVVPGQTSERELQAELGQPTVTQSVPPIEEIREQLAEQRRQSSDALPGERRIFPDGPAERRESGDSASGSGSVRIAEYRDRGERFQIRDSRVEARYRAPEPHESTLQYWKHLWVGKRQVFREITGSGEGHGRRLYQLNAPDLRKTVVYDSHADRVIEVVDYAPAR